MAISRGEASFSLDDDIRKALVVAEPALLPNPPTRLPSDRISAERVRGMSSGAASPLG